MFFGWCVVGACVLISRYTGGIVRFVFTAFFEPIADEFGWSHAQISFAASLVALGTGLFTALFGFLADRWGSRRLIFVGVIVTGLGLMVLSRVSSLVMFYGAFVLIAIGMSACSPTVFLAAVANWFRRNIALAAGITASGMGLGGLLVPLVAGLVDRFGWRGAMAGLGIGVWAICLPLSLLVRHRPEQYGWLPDGDSSADRTGVRAGKGPGSTDNQDLDIPAKQALKSRMFWHISVAFMCQMLVTNAVVIHVMPYFSSVDIARSVSGLVASAAPVVSIFGRVGFGWIGDRLQRKRVTAAGLVLMSLGLVSFGYVGGGRMWLLVPFLALFGVGWGGCVTMRAALLREYFGAQRFGTIYGFTMGVVMLGNISGPAVAGWAFDRWSSYQGVWLAFAGLALAAAVIVATTPRSGTAIRPAGKPGA